MTLAGTWRPSPALARAVVLTGLFVIAGVVLGRVDLVLLATPFALGTAWALRRRPGLPPQLEITGGGFAVEGGDVTGVVSVGNPDTVTYDLAVLRIAVSFWLSLADSERPHVVTVPPRRNLTPHDRETHEREHGNGESRPQRSHLLPGTIADRKTQHRREPGEPENGQRAVYPVEHRANPDPRRHRGLGSDGSFNGHRRLPTRRACRRRARRP